ncbi:unnamed protein product [Onchocerca flexuosa]|uniref:60S ribosomal protein L7a n=1 Tax=Onchocerca flexuosa TaxID=387005 RepID=A0A183HPH6_9BILA|nr:unnamed protein product [Onchocerca flexuosa]
MLLQPITPAKITTKKAGAKVAEGKKVESKKEEKPDAVDSETDDYGYFTMENVGLQVPVRSAVHMMNMKVFQKILQKNLQKKFLADQHKRRHKKKE